MFCIKKIIKNKYYKMLFFIKQNQIRKNSLSKKYANVEVFYDPKRNIGDTLNPLLFEYLKNYFSLSGVTRKKYIVLLMIGSIIGYVDLDCSIWGSGILEPDHINHINSTKYIKRKFYAVRGPLTRKALIDIGYNVPEVYGDPAILLPKIYYPRGVTKKYKVSVIPHFVDKTKKCENLHYINVLTDDYKSFIDEVLSSEIVISSSLHGIIIAEAYGVPAIWLKNNKLNEFKEKAESYLLNPIYVVYCSPESNISEAL